MAKVIQKEKTMSKNQPTIKQLCMACRHIDEMIAEGVTMNHAIRLLELFTDVYAKLFTGGSASPHSAKQVKLWSLAAKKFKSKVSFGKYVRVEHGTPRRAFAHMVLKLYRKQKLNKREMDKLVKKYWKLAVITIEEDRRLGKIARSKMYKTPEQRWRAAGIHF